MVIKTQSLPHNPVSFAEAVEILGMTAGALYAAVHCDRVDAVKVGDQLFFAFESVLSFKQQRTLKATRVAARKASTEV